jgi:hypothetical protein
LETCHELFTPGKPWAKFCCKEHRDKFHHTLEGVRGMENQIILIVNRQLEAFMPRLLRKFNLTVATEPPAALIDKIALRVLELHEQKIKDKTWKGSEEYFLNSLKHLREQDRKEYLNSTK